MKIHDYIEKHRVTAIAPSLTRPETLPPEAYTTDLLVPSFEGRNADSSIFVTLYNHEGTFVVYERGKRRITGIIQIDHDALE